MGGWKLEAGRFLILVGFPVGAFWVFNQPVIFNSFMKNFRLPDSSKNNKLMQEWKESLMEEKRKRDYEKFLREQMAFEETRKLRESNQI